MGRRAGFLSGFVAASRKGLLLGVLGMLLACRLASTLESALLASGAAAVIPSPSVTPSPRPTKVKKTPSPPLITPTPSPLATSSEASGETTEEAFFLTDTTEGYPAELEEFAGEGTTTPLAQGEGNDLYPELPGEDSLYPGLEEGDLYPADELLLDEEEYLLADEEELLDEEEFGEGEGTFLPISPTVPAGRGMAQTPFGPVSPLTVTSPAFALATATPSTAAMLTPFFFRTPTFTATPTPTITPTPLPPPPWVQTQLQATDPRQVRLASGRVQVVVFFAFWSGPSQAMAPLWRAVEQEYRGRVTFIYLDVDDPATAVFKVQLGFRREPHTFLLDGAGKILRQWIGYVDLATLRQALNAALVP